VRLGGAEILVATAAAGAAPHGPSAALAEDLVVADPKSAEVVELARKLARAPSTVLILGKTGVGKEVLSRLIHAWSPRAERPFVRINCAAIPDALLESELFGAERGAFTGADRRRIGHVEAASTGSLFLDEIGELSPSAQAKLLGVLENRVIVRVGGTAEIPVDVRLLCATHRDLRDEVARGRFREDLFYRVSTFTLRVPSLAERPSEIVPLASVFARRFALSLGHAEPRLDARAVDALQAYAWPGNVRELRNAIEHAVVLADGQTLSLEHLPETLRASAPAVGAPAPSTEPQSSAMRERVEDVERRAIEDALAAERGNQTRAAERLGISRRALTYKLAKYGFDRPRK
jgi:DNA-binding NtrC family response regulator